MSYQKQVEYAFFGIISFIGAFGVYYLKEVSGDVNSVKIKIAVIEEHLRLIEMK